MLNSNYKRSNKIVQVDFDVSGQAREIASAILGSQSSEQRQKLGDDLLDELADLAEIDIVKLKISEAKQHHRKRDNRLVFKQYGYYKPGAHYIYINNRTAVRGQILAPKTFLNTLLHEWMHHYDICKLRLDSIHTKGFYLRLNHLQDMLLK
ncbi:MAG: hypothetical protein ABIA47_00205 [bacterium]